LLGKSGKKRLPRLSNFHDPLAVYFAMNLDTSQGYTQERAIAIHTDDDNMRSSVVIIDDKVSMS
jgi:hypothetical protein